MDRFWSGKIGASFERAEKTAAFRAGRRARTARTPQGRGPSAPAPAVVLRALRARKTPPPRRAPPHGNPPTPAPAHLRRPYGGCSWEAGRPGRPRGGGRRRLAAGGRPQGRPPACQTKERGPGQGPRAPLFQDASRPAAAPLLGFPPTPKRQRKARPFVQPSPAPSTTRKKVVATASRCEGACNRAGEPSGAFSGEEPRRNERSPGKGTLPGPSGWSPRRRGQRRHKPPAAGCYPRATAPASARRSPPA